MLQELSKVESTIDVLCELGVSDKNIEIFFKEKLASVNEQSKVSEINLDKKLLEFLFELKKYNIESNFSFDRDKYIEIINKHFGSFEGMINFRDKYRNNIFSAMMLLSQRDDIYIDIARCIYNSFSDEKIIVTVYQPTRYPESAKYLDGDPNKIITNYIPRHKVKPLDWHSLLFEKNGYNLSAYDIMISPYTSAKLLSFAREIANPNDFFNDCCIFYNDYEPIKQQMFRKCIDVFEPFELNRTSLVAMECLNTESQFFKESIYSRFKIDPSYVSALQLLKKAYSEQIHTIQNHHNNNEIKNSSLQ